MALRKSTLATGVFDRPSSKANPAELGQFQLKGTSYTVTASDTTSDNVVLFAIPTSACVRSVLLSSDGAATAGAGDLGIGTLNEAGDTLTAVDLDLFASAQAITTALERSDVIDEAGTITIDERFMPIWQAAGQSTDPGGLYWIVYTPTTQADANTIIAVEAELMQ
mgnify:CR=1 FL=1